MDAILGTDGDSGQPKINGNSNYQGHQRPVPSVVVKAGPAGFAERLAGLPVTPERPFALSGQKTAEGWMGRLEIADYRHLVVAAPLLDATQLRALGDECRRMADLFDERVDWDRIDQR